MDVKPQFDFRQLTIWWRLMAFSFNFWLLHLEQSTDAGLKADRNGAPSNWSTGVKQIIDFNSSSEADNDDECTLRIFSGIKSDELMWFRPEWARSTWNLRKQMGKCKGHSFQLFYLGAVDTDGCLQFASAATFYTQTLHSVSACARISYVVSFPNEIPNK